MKSNVPLNLYTYYLQHPNEFEEKSNPVKKVVYLLAALFCLLLIIKPDFIHFSPILMRVIASTGLLIFISLSQFCAKDYYSKTTGGKIKEIAIKNFDMSFADEDAIVQMFNNNDFHNLITAGGAGDQPIQLYVHEDQRGKTFYFQIKKQLSDCYSSGLTEVKVISGDQYERLYKLVKSSL